MLERISFSNIEDGVETGREVGDGSLGDLADLAELTIGLGTAIQGVLGSEGGEVATLLEHVEEAVGQVLAVLIGLEHHVADRHGLGHGRRRHDTAGIQGVVRADHLDAAQVTGLVPLVAPLGVGIALQESAHVVRADEILVKLHELVVRGGDVRGGRNHLEHDILDVAGRLLLEELLVVVVEILDFLVAHHDGAVGGIGEGNHHEVHVGGGVVVGDGLVHLQGVLHVGVQEQGVVLVVELVGEDLLLEVGPDGLGVLVALLHGAEEVHETVIRERAVLIDEQGGDDRGDVLAVGQVHDLVLTHVDAGGLAVLDEQVLFHETLPDRVTDLLLLLLAGGSVSGHQLIDAGHPVDLRLEIGITDGLATDLAHVILGGDGLDRLDDLARIDDEE